jgi:hypothetical protein
VTFFFRYNQSTEKCIHPCTYMDRPETICVKRGKITLRQVGDRGELHELDGRTGVAESGWVGAGKDGSCPARLLSVRGRARRSLRELRLRRRRDGHGRRREEYGNGRAAR